MDIASITDELDFQLRGLSDADGEEIKVFSLDVGEVFLKTAGGQFFKLSVDEVDAETVSFIDEDSWS
jgi:hypothetical protein